MPSTPQNVLDALSKLDASEQAIVKDYINELESSIAELKGEDPAPVDEEPMVVDDSDFPPLYISGDDVEKQSELKMEASDLKSEGKWEEALEKYTAAVLAAEPSSLLYANRATALLKLDKYAAAERDCDEALKMNPDSAKALRVRGKARKAMGKWEEALADLSQAQQIDFDEGTVDDLKECTEKHVEAEKARAATKVEGEEKLRKRAEANRKARDERAKEEAVRDHGHDGPCDHDAPRGMPGGMPGGMGGMPGMPPGMPPGFMEGLMGDPELASAMQNPKVIAAFSQLMSMPGGPASLMSNPEKLQELMSDPEVGPVMQKLMAKFGAGMMGGGMPGGGASGNDDLDDLPDMDDMPDLE